MWVFRTSVPNACWWCSIPSHNHMCKPRLLVEITMLGVRQEFTMTETKRNSCVHWGENLSKVTEFNYLGRTTMAANDDNLQCNMWLPKLSWNGQNFDKFWCTSQWRRRPLFDSTKWLFWMSFCRDVKRGSYLDAPWTHLKLSTTNVCGWYLDSHFNSCW